MIGEIDLNDPRIMNAREAAQKWKLDDSSIRKRIGDFPNGTIKKFGRDWVVTIRGMEAVFGKLKEDD